MVCQSENQVERQIQLKDRGLMEVPTEKLTLGCKLGEYGVRPLDQAHLYDMAEYMALRKKLSTIITVTKMSDDHYIVLDGNHRVSVIQEIREDIDSEAYETLWARVYENLSIAEARFVAFSQNQLDAQSMAMEPIDTIKIIRTYIEHHPIPTQSPRQTSYYFELYKTLNIPMVNIFCYTYFIFFNF